MSHFVRINRNKNKPVVTKQFSEQFETRHHHAKPLIVTRKIFAIHHLSQPFLYHRTTYIVVVHPLLIPSVVRGIDVDAFHFSVVIRQESFQRL